MPASCTGEVGMSYYISCSPLSAYIVQLYVVWLGGVLR
jgi:hypothetical protein